MKHAWEMMNAYIFVENMKGREHLENLGIGGRITGMWTLRESVGCELNSTGYNLRVH